MVCVQGDDHMYVIDRSKKQTQKIKTMYSNHFEIIKVPGYARILLVRDDNYLKVFSCDKLKLKTLREAPFAAQKAKIYKTLDVLAQKGGVECIYLKSEEN